MTELRALEARQEKQIQQAVWTNGLIWLKNKTTNMKKTRIFLLKKTHDLQTNLINPMHFQLFN